MIMRPARLNDVPGLALLGKESFCATFEHLYSADDLNKFLATAYCEKTIRAQIAMLGISHCLAQENESLIGFCKMSAPSDYAHHSDAKNPIALNQLYTAPDRTGEGIGAALMDWALNHARVANHDAIQLSVYSENFGAQRFYTRYGFTKIADITFEVGEQIDEEFLMELRL
ncbi:GNAT family N-acetyltransferase [Erythrobacter insulae]|uniref:GNAT family N-acetyltransferase n=1 Tax=Erythrobacter insulae TaxID=2584124 RepID=A0A547PCA7_9SPHN|nr:GNAT family N-acetyltransferase [Erythrobacter insulae]TRD11761.1 GNAT family N-acetyltransferase [Erythrobacter insulae]